MGYTPQKARSHPAQGAVRVRERPHVDALDMEGV